MERIKRILNHPQYKKNYKKTLSQEKKRPFCRHNMEHFADVARIAYLYNLEHQLGYDKEMIYAAALLHDIGKWKQYKHKIPHNEASAELAYQILLDTQFQQEEIDLITDAILTHRHFEGDKNSLNFILFFADKKSRLCFDCKSEKKCNWTKEMKNQTLVY